LAVIRGIAPAARATALRICAGCPELAPCRAWAIGPGREEHGIWGGTTPVQRAALRREAAA
jgi:hypothetical protein